MERRLPELLAPAGSMEALEAALMAGADAIYVGGTQLNARMNAKNFDRAQMREAVEKCHARGVRLYVTLNTLVLDREMNEALAYAAFLYEIGVDALIVADMGLALGIKKRLPDFPLHASTQMSGHDLEAARFLREQGFERMVCARELSKENIAFLCRNAPVEIEVFVHGALCVCHSGQCLFSSIVGGRSGNRGQCAQPCRLPYNGKYPLSLKDNCLAGHLKDLIDMGAASLKIEGRMKSPEYVYRVVSIYRKLLDEQRNANAGDIAALSQVFSREGFTDGYYRKAVNDAMLGVRRQEDKINTMSAGVRMKDACKRGVAYTLDRPHVEIAPYRTQRSPEPPKKKKSARFYKASSIPDTAGKQLDVIYLPLDRFDGKKANGVLLPPVIPDDEYEQVRARLIRAKNEGAEHALIGNIGHIALARQAGLILHGDYRLNIFNSASAAFFEELFEDVILSPELILPQVRDIGGEKSFIVYGRLPLMTLEKPVGAPLLRDRRGVQFPVLREGGRDLIFNSLPTYMGDRAELLRGAGICNEHYIFTVEGPKECATVLDYYEKGFPIKKECRRIR